LRGAPLLILISTFKLCKTAFKTWVSENGHGTLICSSTK